MLHFQAHFNGLASTVPTEMELAQKLLPEVPTTRVTPNEISPVLGKFISQGGSILAFLIVLCFLTQAITSLVKAIKA
jgi:hypothetical protein